MSFQCFFFLSRFFLFDLIELVSFDKLNFFDQSENYGSGSGSPDKYVGSAGDIGFGDFVLTGIESLGNVVPLVVFVPI